MSAEPVGVMKCFECIEHVHVHLNNVEPWKYIYLAGLVDGEGSFTIAKFRDPRMRAGIRYEPYLQVGSSNEEVLKWLVQNFGGSYRRSGELKAFLEEEQRWITRTRPYWGWLLHAGGLRQILPEILPYLIIKKREAEVMLEALKRGDMVWGREQLLKVRETSP